jgi:exodeoxyribonuclease V gamma subunit
VLWQQQVDAVEALWHQADAWRRFDSRGQNGRLSLRVDVLLGDDGEDEPLPRRITGVVTDVFPLRDSEAGVQIVSVFPDPNSSKCLKKPEALGFKECVPAFLRWALLRLQRADTDLLPAPVRLTMLALAEPELARQVNAWDEAFCIADAATRPVMREDLRRRLCGLVRLLLKMRRGNSWFYPKSGWEAVRKLMSRGMVTPMAIAQEDIAAEVAKAVAGVWQGFMGERDYAPGYAWLLEGDLVFGDPDTDPDRRALAGLVEDALTLHRLISLHPHGCQEAA